MLTAWFPVLRVKLQSHPLGTKRPLSRIQPSIKLHYLNRKRIIPTVQPYRPTLPFRLSIYGRVVLCGHPHDTVREISFNLLGKFGGLFYSLYGIHLTICTIVIITYKFDNAVMLLNWFVRHSVYLLLVSKFTLVISTTYCSLLLLVAVASVACEAL